ncbi:MTH1187 family thiamine-binding protein [Paenibacillus piri]|uniref:MTH1187 family thiamine-binding protein n=1 Tax=Paenibacillus piri TaxID=2547395 RepID=A0A4R5KPY1_9BACL|nr:MTH1187 family thiamine-binding protein [Paenibacillus piri]TDF97008.1 MTH1187 family thiamine-binding protein [Paenibacillus piri]
MAIVELTIIPIGTASTSLSQYVADIQQVLEQAAEPVHFQMTAMSTIIEGDLKHLFAVIQRLHEVPFHHGAVRVSTSIKIDDRRDKPSSIEQKMKSVRQKLHDS